MSQVGRPPLDASVPRSGFRPMSIEAVRALPLRSRPRYGGHCQRCGARHELAASDAALDAALVLFQHLHRAKRFDCLASGDAAVQGSVCSTNASFQAEGGQMLGVLVAKPALAPPEPSSTLFAFSGSLQGRPVVPGWVPPIVFAEGQPDWLEAGEQRLRQESSAIRHARSSIADEARKLSQELESLDRRFEVELAAMKSMHGARRQARRRQRSLLEQRPQLDQREQLRALDDESSADARLERELRQRAREARAALEARSAALSEELNRRLARRAERSRRLQERVFNSYELQDGSQYSTPLLQAYSGSGFPPTGTGDCCAPKLIQSAHRMGLRPGGLVEFWWGAPPLRGQRQHGHVYASCKPKCEPILGTMLCPADDR